jgi:hypothetical protein
MRGNEVQIGTNTKQSYFPMQVRGTAVKTISSKTGRDSSTGVSRNAQVAENTDL